MSVRLDDPFDVRYATRATGLLRVFNRAGVLSAADVHVAMRLGKLGREPSEPVQLAVALAVRAVRLGSVCIDVASLSSTIALDEDAAVSANELPWPEPDTWVAAVSASPIVAVGVDGDAWRPVRFVDGMLYLDRYWRQEELIRHELDERASRPRPVADSARLAAALRRLWPGPPADRQRLAAAPAALGWGVGLAGGPRTRKTTPPGPVLAVLAR